MAVYKVPQDVEADDKLLGPFSFRQFIYLIIVAIAIFMGWGLSRLFVPLAIIPLPIVLFFGALALPLRKDQPMEMYMAAIVSFYLKPRKRLWKADGIQSLVEITAPKVAEVQRVKNISQTEAQQRLSYLANIADSGGWAIRGVSQPEAPSAMQSDVYFEAQQTEDVLGSDGGVARNFETMISQADAKRHKEVIERMHQPAPTPAAAPIIQPQSVVAQTPEENPFLNYTPASVDFNPYPSSMRQHVITPLGEQTPAQPAIPATQPIARPLAPAPQPAPLAPQPVAQPAPITPPAAPVVLVAVPEPESPISTSEKPLSPGIINLANNADLSIATIANEAKRIQAQESQTLENEVVISLR